MDKSEGAKQIKRLCRETDENKKARINEKGERRRKGSGLLS